MMIHFSIITLSTSLQSSSESMLRGNLTEKSKIDSLTWSCTTQPTATHQRTMLCCYHYSKREGQDVQNSFSAAILRYSQNVCCVVLPSSSKKTYVSKEKENKQVKEDRRQRAVSEGQSRGLLCLPTEQLMVSSPISSDIFNENPRFYLRFILLCSILPLCCPTCAHSHI